MSVWRSNVLTLAKQNTKAYERLKEPTRSSIERICWNLTAFGTWPAQVEVIKQELIRQGAEADSADQSLAEKLGMSEKDYCQMMATNEVKQKLVPGVLLGLKNFFSWLWVFYMADFITEGCPREYGIQWLFFIVSAASIAEGIYYIFRGSREHRFRIEVKKYGLLLAEVLVVTVILVIYFLLRHNGILRGFVIAGNGWLLFGSITLLAVISQVVRNYYLDRQFDEIVS